MEIPLDADRGDSVPVLKKGNIIVTTYLNPQHLKKYFSWLARLLF
jgi:hypothetical protein